MWTRGRVRSPEPGRLIVLHKAKAEEEYEYDAEDRAAVRGRS
jgi:hypothetical protein